MRIKNRTITILLCVVLLAIGSFMSWGHFKFGFSDMNQGISGMKINIPNFGETTEIGDKIVEAINNGEKIRDKNIFSKSVNSWKTNTTIARIRINNWIPVVLGIIIGIILLLVDLGAIKMSMLFPRIILILSGGIVGIFINVMFENDGVGVGSIVSFIALIGLLISSFTLKSDRGQGQVY